MNKKIDEWRNIITNCKSSGLPQKKYCRENNLSYPTFGYWRTKINTVDSPSPSNGNTPFIRHTLSSTIGSSFVLEWSDGMRLKIPVHLGEKDVADLVKRLGITRT